MTDHDRNAATPDRSHAKNEFDRHSKFRTWGEIIAAGCGIVAALAEVIRVFLRDETLLAGISGAVIVIMVLAMALFIFVQYASTRALIRTIVKLNSDLTTEKSVRAVCKTEHKCERDALETEIRDWKRKLQASKTAKKQVAEYFNDLTVRRAEFMQTMQDAIDLATAAREAPTKTPE